MTIALFSDVHANFPAFEAFLKDLDARKIDAVYCLGDLIGYHISPNEIIEEVRKRKIVSIAGNHDLKVKKHTDHNQENDIKNYAYHLVSENNRQYLNALPSTIKSAYRFDQKSLNLVLAHGSPRSVNEYILEDLEENYLLEMMEEVDADVLCVGHSHKPFHRIIQNQENKFKHIINIGSVGKPKDGNPEGCYALLTINSATEASNHSAIKVEFIRFSYDIAKAVKEIENSPLPNELADRLRNAY
ncbi:metallophosphoesterase family protein [Pedobacter cryophilus]|uniref:Metallophosphoesterase family protein n=1 Tax=Pedobacter cryophilus TaxID=2571271 RepID=A0A4U1C6Z6_9SPHI|nr:metallophosphoesterase family protein [Pedobacter cryophilus]TKB99160.1 metallophosphoesterase family protein [Pedobacter cryophilus]